MRRFAVLLVFLTAALLIFTPVAAQTPAPPLTVTLTAQPSATPLPTSTPAPTPSPTPNPIDTCFEKGALACAPAIAREWGAWGVAALIVVILLVSLFVRFEKLLLDKIEELFKSLPFLRPKDAPPEITRDYLKQAVTTYSRFKFRGLPTHVGENSANRLSLDQVYVSLRILTQARGLEDLPEKQGRAALERIAKSESLSLPQALVELKQRRLAIIGIAGSGKSTLLQWAGLACARALLGEKLSDEQKELVRVFGGKAPFPIFIPLRAYNEYCKHNKLARSLKSLLDFLPAHFVEDQAHCEFTTEFFKTQLRKNCLLMFDGVDEVEMEDRRGVQDAVEALLNDFDHPHLYCLIASRFSASYISDQMAGFHRCEVQRLSAKQRRQLVLFWHSAVYTEDPARGKKEAEKLILRLEYAPAQVRELATTPLMATIFCMVSYSHELPRQRAKLYEDAVQVLLTDTIHHEGDFYQGLAEWGGQDWEDRRDHLAFIAFTLQQRSLNKLPESDLVQLIWQEFKANKQEDSEKRARKFLNDIAGRGGLLEEQDREYGFFTHATFQEYLAGRYLAQELDDNAQAEFLEHNFANDQWWEAIRLAAGYLSLGGKNDADRFVNALAQAGKTLEQKASALALAGECLIDMRKRDENTVREVSARLETALTANPPYAPASLRLRLGLALGILGDSRLKPLEPDLCPVLAGIFRMGTCDADKKLLEEQDAKPWGDEQPAHHVYVSGFSIARYPLTNLEYKVFMDAGGYEISDYWSKDGWSWRTGKWDSDLLYISNEITRKAVEDWLKQRPLKLRGSPFFWDDPKWNGNNLPVVGISWFEAEAYCKWLSQKTAKNYRLPTEAEWEKAARGPDGNLWTWGNTWNADACNSNDEDVKDKLGRTSPVGMYPQAVSTCGAQDMPGNVWEWCSDFYDQDVYQTRAGQELKDPTGPAQGNARIMRGGSWCDDRYDARCACRNRSAPGDFYYNVGFRLVCSPSSISEL